MALGFALAGEAPMGADGARISFIELRQSFCMLWVCLCDSGVRSRGVADRRFAGWRGFLTFPNALTLAAEPL